MEVKDSIANVTTIAGAGAMMVDWNSILTMALLATGIILNIVRIVEHKNKSKKYQRPPNPPNLPGKSYSVLLT